MVPAFQAAGVYVSAQARKEADQQEWQKGEQDQSGAVIATAPLHRRKDGRLSSTTRKGDLGLIRFGEGE